MSNNYSEIYKYILAHPDFLDRHPVQILFFKNIESYVYLPGKEGCGNVLLIPESEDPVTSILKFDEEGESEIYHPFVSSSFVSLSEAFDYFNLIKNITETKYSKNRLMKLYQLALQTAEALKIPVPAVILLGKNNTYLNELSPAGFITNLNCAVFANSGISALSFSLFHEFRHAWQRYYKVPEFLNHHPYDPFCGSYKYNLQPDEVDANAFASLCIKRMGYDYRDFIMNNYVPENFSLVEKHMTNIHHFGSSQWVLPEVV